jgi:HK97 family phage major capsid protein
VTPSQILAAFEERHNAVNELRSLADSIGSREWSAEERTSEARLNAAIDGLDTRIANGLREIDRERRNDEARSEAERLGITRDVSGEQRQAVSDADKLRAFARGEARAVEFSPTSFEARAMTVGTSTAGGHTVAPSFYNRLIESMTVNNVVMANNAFILRTAKGEAITLPKLNGRPVASIVAEGGTIGSSDASFLQATLNAYKYAFLTKVSSELLQDSFTDIEALMVRLGGVALGNGTGAHFVAGSGSSQPNGVLTAGTVGVTAAATGAVTADELIDLKYSLGSPYRSKAVWLFNDLTVAEIRKLKDANDQYIWQAGLQVDQPDTLLGRPIMTDPSVPEMATGEIAGLFGDLSGYFARLAGPVRIERSDDFAFDTDEVTLRFIQRADGDLIDLASVKTLVMA